MGQGIAWEKRIGWIFDDALTDVIQLDTGSFLAVGSSEYFNVMQGHLGDETLTLLKLDGQGDTVWFRPLPMLARGGFLLRGEDSSYNYILCSSDTATQKVHLLKVDQDGYLIEDMPIEGSSYLFLTHAILTSSGQILASGIWYNAPNVDMAVLKIEPAFGFAYFINRYSDHPTTYGCYIEETPQGNYLASGVAGSRIWVIELNPDGLEIRRATFYQSRSRTVYNRARVQQAPGGRYIVTGVLAGSSNHFYYYGSYSDFDSSSRLWGGEQGSHVLPANINQDGSMVLLHTLNLHIYFTRFRPDSSVVWEIDITGHDSLNATHINSLAYLSDSSAIGVGFTYLPGNAQEDYYLCRIRGVGSPYHSGPTGIKKASILHPLIAYPTPSSGSLTVHTRNRQPLILCDLTGKTMLKAEPDPSGTTTINISPLPSGMYVLRQGPAMVKVIKQ